MLDFASINWLAVLVATVVYFMLGALWFTPLFGKAYDTATGVNRDPKQKWPAVYYYAPFLSSLMVTISIAVIIASVSVGSALEALSIGLVFGLSVAAISFSNGITPNMPRPHLFGLVVGGYHLVGCVLVSLILNAL